MTFTNSMPFEEGRKAASSRRTPKLSGQIIIFAGRIRHELIEIAAGYRYFGSEFRGLVVNESLHQHFVIGDAGFHGPEELLVAGEVAGELGVAAGEFFD